MQSYRSETQREKIDELILSLTRSLDMIGDDISTEEQRTCCRNPRDAAYSVLARSLMARRDNLSSTIAALNDRSAAITPEWSYT